MSFANSYSASDVASRKAGEAISANRVICFDSSAEDFVHCTVGSNATKATVKMPVGVSLESAAEGEFFSCMETRGKVVRVACAGTVNAGDELEPTTAGKVVAFSENASAYNLVVGAALEDGVDGSTIAMILSPYVYKVA